MKFCLRLVLLLCLALGTKTQDFDLGDALGGDDPTPAPKAPEKPADGDIDLDLLDAFNFGPTKAPAAPVDPKKPAGGGGDADPIPAKPTVKPAQGGGGSFDDKDLYDLGGGDGSYQPDEGRGGGKGGGGRAQDPSYDDGAGGGGGEAQAGSGQIAGIASAIGVAILGAASSYFAYQKKKLCFKLQGGEDPESGKGQRGTNSDPQEQETS